MNWNSWRKRRGWESRMDAEFAFHLDSQINDYIRQGLSRKAAERRARREFGPVDLAKDECRDERAWQWLDHFLRDARYAGRSLRKSPGFAAAAILTLALGIGANTAIFSVVYAVLLKPLPYRQPGRIYSVEVVIPERRAQLPSLPVAVQAFLEWRKADTGFDISALRPWECNVTGDGEPERLGGAQVSANFFSFLGVPPERGRGFSAEEEQPGKERVVVISDSLWRRRYGADPGLVGRSIRLNEESYLVVGIASPSLLVPTGTLLHPLISFAPRIDVWRPIAPTAEELRNESWDYGVLVRLRPGADLERGRQRLEASLNALVHAEQPGIQTELIAQLVPIREIYAGKARLRILLIFGASDAAASYGVHQHRQSVPGQAGQPFGRVRHADCAGRGKGADPEPDAHGDHPARASGRGRRRSAGEIRHSAARGSRPGGGAAPGRHAPESAGPVVCDRGEPADGNAVRSLSGLAGLPEGRGRGAPGRRPGRPGRQPGGALPAGSGGGRDCARNGAAGLCRVAASQLRQGDGRRPRLPGGTGRHGRPGALRPALFDFCKARGVLSRADRKRSLPPRYRGGGRHQRPSRDFRNLGRQPDNLLRGRQRL